MPRLGQKMTPEQIGKIREAKKRLTPEQREHIAAAQRGKKASPETIAKMSASHKGHPVSQQVREAIGNAHRGKVVSEESKEKNRIAHLGKKMSNETRTKISESHTGSKNAFYGKKHTPETLAKMIGSHKSETTKLRMSESKKGITPPNIEILKTSRVGLENSEYQKQRVSEANTGLTRSDETKELISKNRAGILCGPDNHQWNGGTSFFPYCPKFNEARKKAVRNFFGNVCLICGKSHLENLRGTEPIALSVHHIHHNKDEGCNGVGFNLVPLCASCHSHELSHQEEYKEKINAILDAGFASGKWSREQYEKDVMYPD